MLDAERESEIGVPARFLAGENESAVGGVEFTLERSKLTLSFTVVFRGPLVSTIVATRVPGPIVFPERN